VGHVITKDVITLDLENIKTIMEWSVPKNVVDIRSFMGLSGYYQRFIQGFSKVAYLITSLQKKGRTFNCTTECQNNFDHLKHLLTTAPILKIVDPYKDFIVCMDASKEGASGVLMQEGRLVAYESRKHDLI